MKHTFAILAGTLLSVSAWAQNGSLPFDKTEVWISPDQLRKVASITDLAPTAWIKGGIITSFELTVVADHKEQDSVVVTKTAGGATFTKEQLGLIKLWKPGTKALLEQITIMRADKSTAKGTIILRHADDGD